MKWLRGKRRIQDVKNGKGNNNNVNNKDNPAFVNSQIWRSSFLSIRFWSKVIE